LHRESINAIKMEKKETKKMDLLMAFEQIVEKAKDSQLCKEFYRKAGKYIKYVSDILDLTKEQSVMMALFINRSDDSSIRISELSEDVKCSTVRMIRYMNDIDTLENREFIRCCRERNRVSYRVPFEVIEAFKHNERYIPRKCTGLTCQELFGELEDIFELRKDNEITYEVMAQKIDDLFMENDKLEQKISEPGLWFYQSYQPMPDIIKMVYELSVKNGVPVTVLSSCNKWIQQEIIAMVRKDCIDTASDENERNWLEQEMAEYNTHGLFFHPQEMNDYVENGPFWTDYVYFNDEEWLNFSCCPYDVVLIDDIRVLHDYEGETDLTKILPMVHADAIERNKTVVVEAVR